MKNKQSKTPNSFPADLMYSVSLSEINGAFEVVIIVLRVLLKSKGLVVGREITKGRETPMVLMVLQSC